LLEEAMLRLIKYQLFMKKNQVLNTLPLLQRSHSVETIAATRGKRYEVLSH
ncbi:MAG: hypothetical protein FD143_3649, partial [Ignavibacteria bacterium]